MPSSSASAMPSPSAWAQNNPNAVKVHCAACDTEVGTFENLWLPLTKSYIMPKASGSQYRTAVRGSSRQVPASSQQSTIGGCFIAEASCRQCSSIFGHQCMSTGRTGKDDLLGRIFYKQHKIYLSSPETQDEVDFKMSTENSRNHILHRDVHGRRGTQAHSSRDLSPDSLLEHTSHRVPSQRGASSMSVSSTNADSERTSDAYFSKVLQHEAQLERVSTIMEKLQIEMQQVRDTITDLKGSEVAKEQDASSMSLFTNKLATLMGAMQDGDGQEVKVLKAENQALRQRLAALTSSLSSVLTRQAEALSRMKLNGDSKVNGLPVTGKRKRPSESNTAASNLPNGNPSSQVSVHQPNEVAMNGSSHIVRVNNRNMDVPDFSDEELHITEPDRKVNLQTPIVRSDLSPTGNDAQNDQDFVPQIAEIDDTEADSDYQPRTRRRPGRPPRRPPGRPRYIAKPRTAEQKSTPQKTDAVVIKIAPDSSPNGPVEGNPASSAHGEGKSSTALRTHRRQPPSDVAVANTPTAPELGQSSDAFDTTSNFNSARNAQISQRQASDSDISDPPSSPIETERTLRQTRSSGRLQKSENTTVRKDSFNLEVSQGGSRTAGTTARRKKTEPAISAVEEQRRDHSESRQVKLAERERLVKETMEREEREERGAMTEDD